MPMTTQERLMKRSAILVAFANYEAEFRQRFEGLKNIVRTDPISGGRNYTPAQVAEWISQAEAFSTTMDAKQGALLTETMEFLQAATVPLVG